MFHETTRREFALSLAALAAALASGTSVALARPTPADNDSHVIDRRFRGGDEVGDSRGGGGSNSGSGGGSNSSGGGGSSSSGGGSSSDGGGHSGDSSGGSSGGGHSSGGSSSGGKGSSVDSDPDDERFGSKR